MLARLEALEASAVAREQRIELLTEENRWLKAQLFSRSSERTAPSSPDQTPLFNEAEVLAAITAANEADATVKIEAHERKKRGGKRSHDHLPEVEVPHDLPEAEKVCTIHGIALKPMGVEKSRQLHFQPAQACVLVNVRYKYTCPCCEGTIRVAPLPPQILPKSNATASLLGHIVTSKVVDGLPLYRQETQFERLQVRLSRGTMAQWMIKLGGTHVVPIIDLLEEQIRAARLIHFDETRLQVLHSDKEPTADHWMWVRAAGPPGQRIILFDYDPSRGGEVPLRLLQGFTGILLTDGWGAYESVAAKLKLVHAGCWSHLRRGFHDVKKAQDKLKVKAMANVSIAVTALDFIRQVFMIDRLLWDTEHPVSAEQRALVRHDRSAPIVAKFYDWIASVAPQTPPESRLGKAINYAINQRSKLEVFLTQGIVPMSNNICENAIRPFVVARKGFLFSTSQAGATATGRLFSLGQTAIANGVEPYAYFTHLFTQLPAAKTREHYEALLPWRVKGLPTLHNN